MRSSIKELKIVTKAKLDSVNVDPPSVWAVRDSLKEAAITYTRGSTQSRERQKEWERDREKERVKNKTRRLMEQIMQERKDTARKRFIRQEKDKLQSAIEMAQARAAMFKGSSIE